MNKMIKSTFLFQLLILALWVVTPQALYAASDSAGTEFYLAFQPNSPNYAYATDRSLSLFITGKQDTQGTVTIPGLNFNQSFTILANQITTVSIPVGAQNLGENTITKLGVHITAQSEVTVCGLNRFKASADAFLALPVDVLGLEYLAMSYPGDSRYPSQVAVVGAFDNTKVTITPAGAANGHPAGVPFTVVLNRGDAYQIRGSGAADLTGTSITATAPVAVMSGADSVDVPVGIPGSDHLAEMMPPVASWGRSFLTLPLATRINGDIFRILASQDGTEVRINGSIVATLNRGKFLEVVLTTASLIEANAPIMLAQYCTSWYFDDELRADLDVDPSMMLIIPTEQFLNQYTFNSPATGYATHFVNVVVPTAATSTLVLDGSPINASLFSQIGNSGFSGAQVPISAGKHAISGNVEFGIYVYGYASGWGESYAYPGGMAVKFINPRGDSFAPNLKLTPVGDIVQGLATDSEDINANGILDNGEDLNANGIIDRRSEDLNSNGVLDPGEDVNGNGILDQDTGIFKVELEDGASNLKLDVLPFTPGASPVYFTITLLDPSMAGSGIVRVSDGAGNVTKSQISLSGSVPTLKDVRLIDTISTNGIDIDSLSFSKTPYSISTVGDHSVIEWRYDTFPSDALQDLGFDLILKNPVAGEQRLVSHKLELTYVDPNGIQVSTELGSQNVRVLNSAIDSMIASDKSAYQANDDALLNFRLTNLSEYARTIDAKVTIEDGQGALVKEVTVLPSLVFAAGAVKDFSNIVFNIGSIYSGDYRAHLILYESSRQIGEAFVNFKIQPTISLSSKVTTDKASYSANGQVAITTSIQSLSSNYMFSDLKAKFIISNSKGETLFTDLKAIPSLAPNQILDSKTYWNTGLNPPGTYLATFQFLDAAGAVISTATCNFVIDSATKPTALLKGRISLDKQSILTGEPVTVSYSVTNTGNMDLSNIAISVQTVSVNEQTVYGAIANQAILAMGAAYTNSGRIDTQGYSSKDYLVVLRASIAGVEETLAGTYFRVEGAPSAPSLAGPSNGSDIITFSSLLSVNNASDPNDDRLTYEFEIYADSGLASLVTSIGTLPETAGITTWTVPTPLTENQTYYWRARAYDGRLYGPWMALASFRVNTINDPPTAPTISSPADGTTVAEFTPLLSINNASDPDSGNLTYNFQVATNPDFTQIVTSANGVTDGQGTTSWTVPVTLAENGWYYWRAQADDWLSEGPWSTTVRFFVNTTNEAPSVPVIIAPADGSTVTTLAADVAVTNSTDPDSQSLSYYFEADTVPTFDSPNVIRSSSVAEGQGTTHWYVSGFQDNTRYYFRSKASDGSADSPWSAITTIFANTVNDPPTTPTLANPSNGSGVNVFMPALSVHNSTDPDKDLLTYEFEVYADAAMTNLIAHAASTVETLQITSWVIPVALIENQTYYWRARAYDGALTSSWMPAASFMVNTANDAPGAPKLSSPADGSSVATLTPTLAIVNAVDPDSDKLTYEFEIYSGASLVTTISSIPEDISGVTIWTPGLPLSDKTVYQWRARAFDGDNYGPWTAMATFTVHIPETSINATIDFDPDTLDKSSKGTWVVVYIELPSGYKPADIDISSIRLEGAIPAETWPYAIGDHDRDRIPDLMVKFKRSAVINLLSDGASVPVHVMGKVGATLFEGVDVIKVLTHDTGKQECSRKAEDEREGHEREDGHLHSNDDRDGKHDHDDD